MDAKDAAILDAVKAVSEAQAASAAFASTAVQNFVTMDSLKGALLRVASGISGAITPMLARIAKLEARAGSGVTIMAADGVTLNAPGMGLVADAVTRLDQTLRADVTPLYDDSGRLIGARRTATMADETIERGTFAALEARIKALEDRPIESIERRVSRHAEHLARLESRLKALE